MRERNLTRYNQQEAAAKRWNRGVAIAGGALAVGLLAAGAFGVKKHHEHSAEAHRPVGDIYAQSKVVNPTAMLNEHLQGKPKAEAIAQSMQTAMAHKAEESAGRLLNEHLGVAAVPEGKTVLIEYDYEGSTDKKEAITIKEVDTTNTSDITHYATFGMQGDHINKSDIQEVRTLRMRGDDPQSGTVQTLSFSEADGVWSYYGSPATEGAYANEAFAFRSSAAGGVTSLPGLELTQFNLQQNLDAHVN